MPGAIIEPGVPPELRRYALARCDAATRELQALLEVLAVTGPTLTNVHVALQATRRLRRRLEELE